MFVIVYFATKTFIHFSLHKKKFLSVYVCFVKFISNLNEMYFYFNQSCYKYYLSDDISKDGDGMDEQCR